MGWGSLTRIFFGGGSIRGEWKLCLMFGIRRDRLLVEEEMRRT